MGIDRERALGAVRLSLGHLTTADEIEATATALPSPPMPGRVSLAKESHPDGRTLRVAGLAPGRYTLKIDGDAVNPPQ